MLIDEGRGKDSINAVGEEEWVMMELTMDSGASDSVMPKGKCSQIPITESPGSRSEVRYTVATGHTVPNEGERQMRGCTNDWHMRNITMQVADVHKPLCAMSKVCKAGHRIVLDDDGSYIQHKVTGETTTLQQKNGVYVLEFWVAPSSKQVFPRQGR